MAETTSELAPALASRLDHVILGAPDLDDGIAMLENALGVRAIRGGQHLGHGTVNALIPLEGDKFLEVLAPDPGQPPPTRARWVGIDDVRSARLTGWAANGHDLQILVDEAARQGVHLGGVLAGRRRNKDGTALTWDFTDPYTRIADGIVPFLIDWGDTPHPSKLAPPTAKLNAFWAEHPDPAPVQRTLRVLGIDLPVRTGPSPALALNITGPLGRIELR
jgi:catechol 2,3-dioxygenase-like lactoylglutathione lyase family enzyme